MRSCSPDLIHCRHVRSCSPPRRCTIWCSEPVRSVVPYPWDPAAPPGYLVGMYDLMFLTREILQPRSDTSYTCLNCCSLPVRSCSPSPIPRRHVQSDVPYPWDPAAPSRYALGMNFVCMLELLFLTREILQPCCDTSYACLNCWSLSVRSRSPILILFAKPVRSCSPILIVMYDLVFRARGIMQHRSDTSYARSIWCFEPVIHISWSQLLKPSRHVDL